jgi:hypothetical protein
MQMLAFVVRVRVRRNVEADGIYKEGIKVWNKFTFAHAYNIILHRHERTESNNSDHNSPPRSVTLGISFILFPVGNILLQQLQTPLTILFGGFLMLFHGLPNQWVRGPESVGMELRVVSLTF